MRKEEVIYLYKEDLNKASEDVKFEDINYRHFQSIKLDYTTFQKANLVIYVCYENFPRHKILKSRYF